MATIIHLKNEQLDKTKWDEAIDASANKSVYALSWYLDIVSPDWEALIKGDYESIMPLPAKQKFGIHYLIQPVLCQQLGIFSKSIDSNITSFPDQIPVHFRFININLHQNSFSEKNTQKLTKRVNHELILNSTYQELQKNYSRRTSRNIKIAQDAGLTLIYNMQPANFVDFKVSYAKPSLSKGFIKVFKALCNHSVENNFGKIIAAQNKKDEIISAAFYIQSCNRVYFLVTVSNKEGKETSAMSLILDLIIREFAGSNYILDFTGSSLKGVAFFNEGFGAKPSTYYSFISNRLPFLLKLLKK